MSSSEKVVKELYKLSNQISIVYRKLAELEMKHQLHSTMYSDLVELLRSLTIKFQRCLHTTKYWNREMIDVLSLSNAICDYNPEDPFDFMEEILTDDRLAIKRVVQHIYSLEGEYRHNISDYLPIEEEEEEEENYNPIRVFLRERKIIKEEPEENIEEYMDALIELDYLKSSLELEMFMAYLLEEIEKTKNKEVRNELIRIKYRMILLFDNLEMTFLSNPKKVVNIKHYQDLLEKLFAKEPRTTVNYMLTIRYITHELQAYLIDKEVSTDWKSKIQDILYVIKLKSLTSLVYNKDIQEEIFENAEIAGQLASNHNNKKLLKKSSEINHQLNIPVEK